MKTLIVKAVAAVLFAVTAVSLSGCGTVVQESAMEWMQRQPWTSDSPS